MEKTNDFKESLNRRLSSVVLSSGLKNRINIAVQQEKETSEPKKTGLKLRACRVAVLVVACTLIMAVGVTVGAGVLPGFEAFVGHMGEGFRSNVQPLSAFSDYEGIRMEVVAAVHDGESTIVYLTMQDQIANRIDETTELKSVHVGNDGFEAWSEQAHFDTETKTATFKVYSQNLVPLTEQPLMVSVHSILSGKREKTGVFTGYTVASLSAQEAQSNAPTLADGYFSDVRGYSIAWGNQSRNFNEKIEETISKGKMLLVPEWNRPVSLLGKGWVSLAGSGVINDMLHLQYNLDTGAKRFNRVNFHLEYPGQNEETYLTKATLNIAAPFGNYNSEHSPRCEDVFELPNGVSAQEVRLMVDICEWETYLVGVWSVSYVPDTSAETKTATVDYLFDGWRAQSATLSCLGFAVNGKLLGAYDENLVFDNIEVKIYLKNGVPLSFEGNTASWGDDGQVTYKTEFKHPVNVESIDKVFVEDCEIAFLEAPQ